MRRAIGCEALAVNAVLAAILTVRHPGDDVTAVTETGHRRLVLMVISIGVDLELTARNRCRRIHTRCRKLLAEDSVVAAVGEPGVCPGRIARLITPGHDKVTAAEIRHRWVMLVIRRVTVDGKLIAQHLSIAIKTLANDAVASIIVIGNVAIPCAVRFPGNDEATVA